MKWNLILLVVAGLLMAGIVGFAFAHGSAISVMNPAGIVAQQERDVIVLTVALSAIVVIPVFVMLFFFAWKYRADNPKASRKHQPNWDHDSWINELVWWLVPSIIIVILGVVAWKSTHQLDPYVPLQGSGTPVTIDVVALDWKWLFIYPDQGIASVNMLEIPENTPIHFFITADAPMNSFWIPSLGGQIMAMPGIQTQLNLLANTTGTYTGVSGNISGKGFAGMNFPVTSVTANDFDTWVASVQQRGSSLDSQSYATLAQPSENVAPVTYAPIDKNLYTSIINRYMTPTTTTAPAMTDMAQMTDMPGMGPATP